MRRANVIQVSGTIVFCCRIGPIGRAGCGGRGGVGRMRRGGPAGAGCGRRRRAGAQRSRGAGGRSEDQSLKLTKRYCVRPLLLMAHKKPQDYNVQLQSGLHPSAALGARGGRHEKQEST